MSIESPDYTFPVSVHQRHADSAVEHINRIVGYIHANDSTYERELRQAWEIEVMIANLVRYAEAIDSRAMGKPDAT